GTPASIRALPGVAGAVGSQVEVLLDGGIRRGSDVVKALALGARAVMIGRAYLWGLAANGSAGVRNVFDILRGGIDSALLGLWREFDAEVAAIRTALAAVPAGMAMMDAIRQAVVAANHYRAEDVPELRARMNLIISVPALQASAAVRYDAWERAISDFAATRI